VTEAVPPKANKNYPFYIAAKSSDAKTTEANSKSAEVNPPVNSFAKPKLAPNVGSEKVKLDTNKLPPLPQAVQTTANIEARDIPIDDAKPKIEEQSKIAPDNGEKIETKIEPEENLEFIPSEEAEGYDDFAPFAMRFNAGLFDLIIGSFSSLFLLAPFMLLGGDWFSTAGIFAFLATCAVVMFIYTTTAVGLYGRTFGMRLFSLEVVDIDSEDYPTFHQAAVSTAVYLLSLALGGLGFLTIPFNENKRAVHDLVSRTVVVKE
jgi:uncharacterized RDD family membrane protein YckC